MGKCFLIEHKIHRKPTFTDYLVSGVDINLITVFDFTAGDGTPEEIEKK